MGTSHQDGIFQQFHVILADESVLIHIYRLWTTSPQVGDLHIAHELAALPFLADHQKMPPPRGLCLRSSQSCQARRYCVLARSWLSQKRRGQAFKIRFSPILRCILIPLSLKLMEAKHQHTGICVL